MRYDLNASNIERAAGYAGIAIRYTFYLAGAFVFLVISLISMWVWNRLPPSVASMQAEPVFQIGASQLSARPQVAKAMNQPGGWVESLQYGQLYDRDVDMTVLLVVPTAQTQSLTRNFAREISDLRPITLRLYQPGESYYDLETRFGPVRAAPFSVNADGRIKLCASFLSRFDTAAVYYKGWYCEANGARPNFNALACALDQLKLKKPLSSADANSFLQERMKRPARCTAEPVSQTTDVNSSRRPLQRLIR